MGLGSQPRGRSEARLVALILVIMLMLPACAPDILGPPVSAAPGISAIVDLDPAQQEAEVTQSHMGEANFSGSVMVDQPAPLSSQVTISGSVTTGWPIEISPQSFQITGPTTVTFTVVVIVPPATNALLAGTMRVTASVKAPMMSPVEVETSAVVTVGQYHKVRIEADDYTLEMDRGESKDVQLTIYNDGNGPDTFSISLVDVPSGLTAVLGQIKMTIPPDEFQTLVLRVETKRGAEGGVHTLLIRVDCDQVEDDVSYRKECPIQVSVETLSDNLTRPVLVVPLVLFAGVLVALFIVRRRRRGGEE